MIELNYKLNEEDLAKSINEAIKLEDNEQMFDHLCEVKRAKLELEDALEKLEKVEIVAKGLINSKAKQLYGPNWTAIKSNKYKIVRYFSGSIYSKIEGMKTPKRFIVIKETLNSKEIDKELESTGKLPSGLELNDNRSEVIKVTIQ